ncbi:MAG: dihydrodipicolinate synthase family protein [Chloroflexi bacterium]|nr:dihydrodipicolinate synthase family protein [Chloroflexota bacterium]
MITPEQAKARWRGVVIPLVTPFKKNGDLDLDALRTNVQWILDKGARQGNTILLAAGSGGDFTTMNIAERKQVIKTVADVTGDRLPIIAGVQALDIRDCIDLCKFSESLGIDGVQISGAFYYDGRAADVIAWIQEVARHTKVGFAAYNHFYSGAKYDLPIDVAEKLLEIPNVVGLKWASADFDKFQEGVRRFSPRVAVVNNTFVTILGHMLGCQAFVSHWPNFYPEFCWRIWDLMEAQRYVEAQHEFDRVMRPYSAMVGKIARQTAGEGVFVRPGMAAVGLNGGYSRLPSRDEAVTPEIREEFRRLLADIAP